MLKALQDAQSRPDLFCWFGAIPLTELDGWLTRRELVPPQELLEFWSVTGGGDAFESETFLRPHVPSVPHASFIEGDYLESRNAAYQTEGLLKELLLFEEGVFRSAVSMTDGRFVTLKPNYAVAATFNSFDDWYSATLRAEFAKRYGL